MERIDQLKIELNQIECEIYIKNSIMRLSKLAGKYSRENYNQMTKKNYRQLRQLLKAICDLYSIEEPVNISKIAEGMLKSIRR